LRLLRIVLLFIALELATGHVSEDLAHLDLSNFFAGRCNFMRIVGVVVVIGDADVVIVSREAFYLSAVYD
jgi:hypothetical protein